jgi:hypothetical protein
MREQSMFYVLQRWNTASNVEEVENASVVIKHGMMTPLKWLDVKVGMLCLALRVAAL